MHVCTGARHPSMHVGISASSSAPSGAVRSDCIAVPHASSQRAACFAAVEYSEYLVPTQVHRRQEVPGRPEGPSLATLHGIPRPCVCGGARAVYLPLASTQRPHARPFRRHRRPPPPPPPSKHLVQAHALVHAHTWPADLTQLRATYNVQHTTCNIQRAACNIQCATCSIQRATHNVQHTTRNTQRAAYNVQHTA
jgi:hypothetical protein